MPYSPLPDTTGATPPQTPARWTVHARGASNRTAVAEFGQGCWLVGGFDEADLVLADAHPADSAVALDIDAHGLVLCPAGSGAVLVLADGGLRTLRATGERFDGRAAVRLRCGGVDLELRPPAALPEAPGSAEVASRGGLGARLRAAFALIAVALAAVVAWPGASDASRPPAPADAAAELEGLLARHGLHDRLALHAEAGVPELRGVLHDEAACARLAAVRADMGADRFLDRSTCLPALAGAVQGWLAGSGLAVELRGDRVAVHGSARDAAVQAQVAAAVATLGEGGRLDVSGVAAPGAAPEDPAARQLRRRIVAVHGGAHGYVVTREGQHVYAGGRLGEGLELLEVGDAELLVRTAAGPLRVAL